MDSNRKALSMWNGWSAAREGIPVYDSWLDSFLDEMSLYQNEQILELGCGIGADTRYLTEHGFSVLATDYSKEALRSVRKNISGCTAQHLDMNDSFPFEDASFHIVIADISLHYFNDLKTRQIMREIGRVLKPEGFLLARVSSMNDTYYGAGQGREIEHHFYDHGSYAQRYFDEDDLRKYFGLIGDFSYIEKPMTRQEPYYSYPKYLYQVKAVKK